MVHTTLKIVQVISQALQNGWVQSSTHSQALHSTTECLLSHPSRFNQGEVSDMRIVGKTQIQSGCEGEKTREADYVQRNTQARSRDYCYSGNTTIHCVFLHCLINGQNIIEEKMCVITLV